VEYGELIRAHSLARASEIAGFAAVLGGVLAVASVGALVFAIVGISTPLYLRLSGRVPLRAVA
jgi:hypothetical protein